MEHLGRSVQRTMSAPEKIVHAILLLVTCGCWYPFYHHRKKSIARVVDHYR